MGTGVVLLGTYNTDTMLLYLLKLFEQKQFGNGELLTLSGFAQ